MFEEALAEDNYHLFSVTRKGTEYFLKKKSEVKPNEESHIYSGTYKEARKLWSKLIKIS